MIVTAISLMNLSCSKEKDPGQTLEQKYPDWTNLTWVATNNNPSAEIYPKLTIKIEGNYENDVCRTQLYSSD